MTVYNWENNRTAPSLHQIPKVIKFLEYHPYITNETFGGRIIRTRRALGMTQKELARELGVDPTTLGYWERGERRLTKELEEKNKSISCFLRERRFSLSSNPVRL